MDYKCLAWEFYLVMYHLVGWSEVDSSKKGKKLWVSNIWISVNTSKGNAILKFKSLQGLFRFNIKYFISLGISLAHPHEVRARKFWILVHIYAVYLFTEPLICYDFMVALHYVCQIAKKEQTLHTYLKKGWEGTHHHDNTGRSRMYAIKKCQAMPCISLVKTMQMKKNPKNIFVCTDKLKHAHMHMIPKPHKT